MTILHVDMDAFFASVEVLDQPELRGKAVIVGGDGARGVVASCSYEARGFGIRSAMPSVRARQLCPHAVFLPGRFSRYSEMSARLHAVMADFTPIVEPIGLDEAFLDVTGARRLLGAAPEIAHAIRARVLDDLGLSCSVGVARTKLIAKLASRAAKPTATPRHITPGRGVFVVTPDEEIDFLHPLPVEAIWGVGPATARQLHALGIVTVRDLAQVPEATLVRRFGSAHGRHLATLARGDDDREVEADRKTKSIGHEETFRYDIKDVAELQTHVVRMSDSVASHLHRNEMVAKTISIKIRYGDFTTISRSHTLSGGVDTTAAISAIAHALLDAVDLGDGIRLLGVSASGLIDAGTARQLSFSLEDGAPSSDAALGGQASDEVQGAWQEVSAAVDAIRVRFGHGVLGPTALIGSKGLPTTRRRDSPWGPVEPD